MQKQTIDNIPQLTARQITATEAITALKIKKGKWVTLRTNTPNKIMLKEIPDASRYNKLKTESKLFINVIKMICYSAETAMAASIAPSFYKQNNNRRILIKQLFNTPADIKEDQNNQTLTIIIASLSAPRYNEAIKELCTILNQMETLFSGTTLRLIYKNHVA